MKTCALCISLALVLVLGMAHPSWAIEKLPAIGPVIGLTEPQHDQTCGIPYSNPNKGDFAFFQPAGEILDDLHMEAAFVGPELLCAFDVRIHNITTDATTFEVNIYENNAVDNAPGGVIAGPYLVPLPGLFLGLFHHEVAAGTVNKDVWFGIKFPTSLTYVWTDATAPAIGTSHSLTWLRDAVNSGPSANPVNMFVTLYTKDGAVQIESATWGTLKAHYR